MMAGAACRVHQAREGAPHLELVGLTEEQSLAALGGDAVVEYVDGSAGSEQVVSTSRCARSWLDPGPRGLIYLRVSR